MAHWKLTLSYDGTGFHGWQVQPGLPTIQGTLAEALHRITGETVLPQGSGRTDAGVHALAQVASVTLEADVPPPNLQRALNSVLPPSIRILAADIAVADFHARHSALRKTYEYRIFEQRLSPISPSEASESEFDSADTGCPILATVSSSLGWGPAPVSRPDDAPDLANHHRVCPPFLAPYAWPCRWPLDLASMNEAAALLCGEHDFASFAASDPDRTSRSVATTGTIKYPEASASGLIRSEEDPGFGPQGMLSLRVANSIRTIHSSHFLRTPDLLLYTITGNGFLHHMVRNIVGTLVDVGRGALTPTQVQQILAVKDRTQAGPTAPAQGLFLVSVDYPEPTT